MDDQPYESGRGVVVEAPRVLERAGCRLAYTTCGSGDPVLFIQGVGVHGAGWLPQIDVMSRHHRCLRFDNRGIGASQPMGEKLTVAGMAEDALALMDAEGWGAAHVVGHSLGGLIALELAARSRARVRSLALLCTFARGRVATRLSGRMLWIGMRSRIGPRRWRRAAFLELVMPPAALEGIDRDAMAGRLMPLFGHDLADQPPIVMKQLRAMAAYDASPLLGRLEGIPTLVISATHDPIAPPEAGREIARGIAGAQFIEIPDASHGVTIQQPERINRLLLEHFRGSSG